MPIRTSVAAGVVVAALTVGGATVIAPALSSAQEDDSTTTSDTTEAPTTTEAPGKHAPRGHAGPRLDALAELLGITREELFQALRDGQSIAEVAQANGVDPQTVIDELTAQARARIEEQLAELPARIEDFVNGEFERPGPRGPHGPFGDRHGPGHDAPEADPGD